MLGWVCRLYYSSYSFSAIHSGIFNSSSRCVVKPLSSMVCSALAMIQSSLSMSVLKPDTEPCISGQKFGKHIDFAVLPASVFSKDKLPGVRLLFDGKFALPAHSGVLRNRHPRLRDADNNGASRQRHDCWLCFACPHALSSHLVLLMLDYP